MDSVGKHASYEIEMSRRIDRFGVHAVMGRPVLYEREMRAMIVANNIKIAYKERSHAPDWTAWMKQNESKGNLLFRASQAYNELYNDTSG